MSGENKGSAPGAEPVKKPVVQFRAVPRDLPDREPFANLTPHGKLLLLVLKLTLGPAGIEVISPRRFAATFEERTGLTPAELETSLNELRDAGCLEIERSVVWCVWQLAEEPTMRPSNPTHRLKIQRDIAMLPEQPIRERFKVTYREWFSDGT